MARDAQAETRRVNVTFVDYSPAAGQMSREIVECDLEGRPVDDGYEMYCLTDPVFYDTFILKNADDHDFELAQAHVPHGWQRSEFGHWLAYVPEKPKLPLQGWKIHVSACVDNVEDILAATWTYCIANDVPFKFIRSRDLFFLRNVKYAKRESSGKFVTIYPADDAELRIVLTELGDALAGQPGPYILSDLRWGAGPLYVRYGGFAERHCIGAGGELVPALEDATGRLVPDRRGTTFQVPPWVTLPEFLEPPLEARNSTSLEELPYRIDRALHFSNGGGVYAGTHLPTGEDVVLKEARPHAGLAWDGADAVARLGRERDTLQRLAGLDVVPALRDYFTLADHHFLVEDFVEGSTLQSQIVRRFPIGVLGAGDETAVAEYASWALDMCARVEAAVAQLHDRDVVIGDLSATNMLVRDDGSIVLIDLEVATLSGDEGRPTVATSAFMPPASQTGLAVDRYALACLRLFVFLPQLTALFRLDPDKARPLAASIAETFPVPEEFLASAVSVIESAQEPAGATATGRRPPRLAPDPQAWWDARDSMFAAILASATPDRQDRLFPGDPRQFFTSGGLNLAYGAAGVLYALHETGAPRQPEHEQWLARRATDPPPGTPLGLYDGLLGVAYVLDRLGCRNDALSVLGICVDALEGKLEQFGLDLSGGLAGIGLTLAYFAARTDDVTLWDAVWAIADLVAERLGDADSVAQTSGGAEPHAGLLRGSSGPALMFLRLHEHRPDHGLLELAATAIRQDLRRCVPTRHGALYVDEGWRTLPYIADGSVGIGFAVDDYLAHREDEQFAQVAPQIRRAAKSGFYVGSGLFSGRAGMILYLSRGLAPGAGGEDPVVAGHVRRLDWHALSYEGHLAFPGDRLMRLSMDLGTGAAGVLLALGAALHDGPVHLPFLGPLHADSSRTDPDLILITEGR
ncbi:MAG: putative SapB synthase [Solirubrobacteraceae bacterium]|nr:putative SapB synthase [Solirubrobacteraceae bacterium]